MAEHLICGGATYVPEDGIAGNLFFFYFLFFLMKYSIST